MNREQALEILKEMAFTAYGHRFEALETAINALSADVRENRTSEDCISRQAVLTIAKNSYLDLGKWEDCKVFCAEIRALPSVENKSEKGGE